MDPQPNQIPSFGYTAGTMDLGKDFTGGLQAGTALGKDVGEGISAALGVATRSQAAHDTLDAMAQNKILSADAYASIKGKSLTAQEQLIGMYANQWIAQQAQQRELQKIAYTGQVQVATEAGMTAEKLKMIQAGYPGLAGVKPGSLPITVGSGASGGSSVAPPPSLPAGVAPLGGTTANPTPLAQVDITNPRSQQPAQLKIGAPVGGNAQHPPNWQLKSVRGQPGYMEPDGLTFHPLIAQSYNLPSQFGGAGGA